MSQSLAALFLEPGRIELRHVDRPDPAPGEVLVRVLGCTICGSDLHTYHGRRTTPTPTVLGHEIVGRIETWGGTAPPRDLADQPLAAGDRITWAVVTRCGTCFFCQHDLPQKCEQGIKYGHVAARPGAELRGGLAEHCLLAPGTAIVRVPDDLPLETVCPASCGTATIAAALDAAGAVADRTVCILGLGLLGLTAAAMFTEAGARVIGVDPVSERRQLAARFGADATVAPADLEAAVAAATGGRGADVVLELSGAAQAVRSTWPLARVGSVWLLVGAVFPGADLVLPMDEVVRRHATLRGIHNYAPRHLQDAVAFLQRRHGHHPFHELVRRWLPLEQVTHAFVQAAQPGTIRVGVAGS